MSDFKWSSVRQIVRVLMLSGLWLAAALVMPDAKAQTYTVLHSFTGGSDGGYPNAGVIRDSAGKLYGTTESGGALTSACSFVGCGTVYKLDPTGKETVLYNFCSQPSCSDGATPFAGVIRDSAGNLYGTTAYGGAPGSCLCGTLYKLDTTGKQTMLYSFTGASDGGSPRAGVIRDSAGNLYGTTMYGGNPACFDGCGVVYKVDTTGKETVLYTFSGNDGQNPQSGVVRDAAGNLYGATYYGGPSNRGVVFKLDTTGKYTVLYSFPEESDGRYPSGVIRDLAGNLYGTTAYGGASGSCGFVFGCGTVYKLDTTGTQTVLYSFAERRGWTPFAGIIRDSAGDLYGTAYYGGTSGRGVVYKLDTNGKETVLYSFTGGTDGGNPYAGVIRDSAGTFYGTTVSGGSYNYGVVFKLAP